MIISKTGNLLNDSADILVNTVNCVGVMGAGLAKQFKAKYPEIFGPYLVFCKERAAPGCIFPIRAKDGKMIINAFTKQHWKSPSQINWVIECAGRIGVFLSDSPQFKSIALAPLGCGLGGLDWYEVKPFIIASMMYAEDTRKHLHYPELDVRIYEP